MSTRHPRWVLFFSWWWMSFSWGWVFSWNGSSFFFNHCRNPNVVLTFYLVPNLPTRARVLTVPLLECFCLCLCLYPKDWRLTFFKGLATFSNGSKREPRSLYPRLVEEVPFLTGILLVDTALPFLTGPEGVICGLGVDGLPFIMRFNYCSTGPVTKSPSSSSSSPGGPPGAPAPTPPGN